MDPAQTPPPLPDLDVMLIVARHLEAASANDARAAGIEPDDLIRHVPGKRAIFRAEFEGRRAVVRMDLRPGHDRTAREWAELRRLWPHMNTGRMRIAEPLYARPERGLMVIADVPGTPLLEHLWGLAPEARAHHLPAAARWLRKSTEISEDWQAASVRGWLRRARAASDTQVWPALAAHEADILTEMARLGALIDGRQWRTAISHGDFHPNNLIADGDRLTGIDIGGSQRLPIYKDMARFLMHLGRRRVDMGGPLCLGVSRAGLGAFGAAFGLGPAERDLFVPFFVAFEALIRVETAQLPRSRIRRAERMYRDLLPDLRRAGAGVPLFDS